MAVPIAQVGKVCCPVAVESSRVFLVTRYTTRRPPYWPAVGQDMGASLMVIPDLHLARLLRGRLAGWGEEQSSWLCIHHARSIHLERLWGPELSSPPTGDPPSVWLSGLGSTVKDPRPSLCCPVLLIRQNVPLPSTLGWMQGEEGAITSVGCGF